MHKIATIVCNWHFISRKVRYECSLKSTTYKRTTTSEDEKRGERFKKFLVQKFGFIREKNVKIKQGEKIKKKV